MSHYQSRGDRSEAQLKKAGRSSGPGHQRSGAPSTAVKGGGAGGPSPSGSAPPASGVSQINSQSFLAGNTSGRPTTPGSGRPTTPGSSTNRGGKRANGPAGVGRNAQSGGSTDHGGNFRNPHHTGAQYQSHQPQQQQQQQPASVSRQGVGPADTNQHPPTSTAQQSELKQGAPAAQSPNTFSGSRASGTGGASLPRQPSNPVVSGAAAKPPAPVVPSTNAALPDLASPVATASSGDNVRASMQPSFSFQFGSISPGFMGPGPGMQIPARTSSAPPNFEEQKREQARFEASRAVVPKKVPTVTSGQQQVLVTGAAGNASEQPHAALQTNQNANIQGSKSGVGTPVVEPPLATKPQGVAQQPVQFSQGQGHSMSVQGHVAQHSQAPIHNPATVQAQSQHFQHMQLVQAQVQAQAQAHQAQVQQAHAQQQHQQQTHQQQPHQQQSQQQPPQQQQHQVLAQQALPQQALVQQSLSQGMKYPQSLMPPHGPQIIPQQMGSSLPGQPQMAHQLGPSMGGAMGGQLPPGISGAQYVPSNPYIQPQPSRAIKIVNPATREEVRLDGMDPGPPASVAASSVRVTSNGPPQNRSVTYSSHHAIPNYYAQGGAYGQAPFYQPGPPKSVLAQGPVNPSPRNFYRHMNASGAVTNPPASKGVPSGGTGGGLAGQAGMDVSSQGAAPLVVSSLGGPPHPIVQTGLPVLSGRPVATSSPMLQPGASHTPASNGRVPSSVPASAVTSSSVPPNTPASSGVVLKFGDVEASNSAGSTSPGESPAENISPSQIPSSGPNGTLSAADPGVPHQALPASASEGPSERKEQVSKTTVPPATTTRPSISVPSSKISSASLATSTTSPRVVAVPPGVSPVSGEKLKTENAKPTTISRENSRKMKKEQKQQKQQHQQQPVPIPAVSLESEVDRKCESLTPTPASGAGNSQVISITSGAAVQLASPKTSHPVVQAPGGPIKATNSSEKSEDSKGTLKAAEVEKSSSGKFSGLSPHNSELSVSTPTPLSSEVEEGVRRLSKQISTSKSLERKDVLTTDSSSAKGGVAFKVNSFSKATLSVPAIKEPVGRGADPSLKDGPGIKISPTPSVLNNSNLAAENAFVEPSAVDAVSDVASVGRTELEVDDSGVKTSTIPPKSSPVPAVPEVLSDDEGVSKVGREPSPPEVGNETRLAEAPALDSMVSKDFDVPSDSRSNGRVGMDGQVVLEGPADSGLSIVKGTAASSVDSIPVETPSVDKEVLEHDDQFVDVGAIPDSPKVELATSKDQQSELAAPAVERELGAEDFSLSMAVAQEIETPVVDVPVVDIEFDSSIDLEGATDNSVNEVEIKSSTTPSESEIVVQDNLESSVGSIVEPSAAELSSREEPIVTGNGPNGLLSDDGVSLSSVPVIPPELHVPENDEAVEEHNLKENRDNVGVAGGTAIGEVDNLSTSVPEVKQVGSKKKKKKEIFAKADAQGSTGDLFTAYKAPEDKKLDEVKRPETPGSANPGTDAKKDPQSNLEKPVLKELDDWEDAAELPTPKIAPMPSSVASNVSLVPGEVLSEGDTGVKKYTKDYLMSQRDLHRDLPLQFEIRADIADVLLNPQLREGFTDSLPSPGRSLDRQSSGGPRLDRRNSIVGAEEDRWTRNAGNVSSPGRGPSDARMDIGMVGPPGGFRPGQASPGIMRMPAGLSPRMGGPGLMSPGMGGLLPGGPLLPMMPPGPGRNLGGVDADRWQRAPVAQKGLIPSPRTPLPAIHKTENRYQVGTISDEEQLKQRLIKGILNKLTPQNFDKLFAQVKEVNIDSATTLTGVISQIFDKALTEPTFCEMYAKFCVQLAVELPEFMEDEEKITFKRVLLNKCQEEFERGEREQEEAEKVEEDGEVKLTPEEREEKRTSARRRMLGNIRFIGELYKKNMLTERIMHECIKKLLGEYQNPDEEDVEALCKLMSTIGRIIDHIKAKEHIDAYFKRMEKLSENMKLSSRLRFMLKDVIDLRRNGWTERRKVEGPKKIDEVHRDAVQERQQAASDRNRPQQRVGMGPGGGRRPANDYGMRGPPSPMYSAGVQMGGGMGMGMGMGGMRGVQPPPGRGGFGQDVRMEDRLLMGESRPMAMPLSQRPSDEVKLGPQGGLGRGMTTRQPIVTGRSALAEVPPMMVVDVRRPGMGPMPGFGGIMPDRGQYPGREELSMRSQFSERPLGSDRPSDRPLLVSPSVERLVPSLSGRDLRGSDRPVERQPLSLAPSSSSRPLTPPTPVVARSAPTAALPLSEEDLKKKSISTLTEYFSVRDMKEAALCVDDLKNPKFHSKMVSVWVSEALDKKDVERELLTKLLIYMCKEKEPPLLSQEHMSRGFELVLSTLEDTTVDVPRAPEYVGGMFAKLVIAGVFSLPQVGKLVKEGGMEPGSLVEIGDALNLIGLVLDTIRKEKGESAMIELYRESKTNLEHFLSPDDKKKAGKFETFLERNHLHCLYPMIPVEIYFREAIARDEPGSEILKWVETNVPESINSDAAFFSMVMTEVLRHSVPLDAGGQLVTNNLENVLGEKIKKFAFLLKRLLPKSLRASEANQRHYIVAVQLFANELGHPPGLITTLFIKLYAEDVISEQVFLKWKDDVKDSTPGRDKAIKETFNWFRWLESAPEEGGDDDE